MTDVGPDTLARRKAQLLARLAELDHRLHDIADELMTHQSRDWEDLATEREQDEALTALGDDGKHEIRAILAALGRIEVGGYGDCVTCGAAIAEARLDLLPATPFCSQCAH